MKRVQIADKILLILMAFTGSYISIVNGTPSHSVSSRRYPRGYRDITKIIFTTHPDEEYQGYYRHRHSYPIMRAHKEMMDASLSDTITTTSSTPMVMDEEEPTSLWPPWPFSLLSRRSSNPSRSLHRPTRGISISNSSGVGIFFNYLREKGKIAIHQLSMMGSALSFHLPPAAAPITLLVLLPSTSPQTVIDSVTNLPVPVVNKSLLQQLHSISRRFALVSLGVAVLSWAEYEVQKKNRLTPLPLVYPDIQNAILPPFLPEDSKYVFHSRHDDKESEENDDRKDIEQQINTSDFFQDGKIDLPNLTKNLSNVYKSHSPDGLWNSWTKLRMIKQKEEYELKRRKILDELMVLQQLKRERDRRWEARKKSIMDNINSSISGIGSVGNTAKKPAVVKPLGYALVTGASGGIGRALAVELARWEVPLILVARDLEKLNTLSQELRAAYGIECCVIQADLSKPNVARSLYETTKKAGMNVDILVNNAGVCTVGELINASEDELNQMVNVNVGSVTSLSRLYGQDMKKQRRGRILFVSSAVGSAPGGPGVATYSATKAYEKSLALSMGIEMEKYGVGVTCLMPGAVKGTSFASRSNSEEAICWKFPMYPMCAPDVASRGVSALLAGNSEVIPGWHNRIFLRVLSPLLPQRTTTKLVGFSFSPIRLSLPWVVQQERSVEDVDNSTPESWFMKVRPRTLKLNEDKSQHINNNDIHRAEKVEQIESDAEDGSDLMHSQGTVESDGISQTSNKMESGNSTFDEQELNHLN